MPARASMQADMRLDTTVTEVLTFLHTYWPTSVPFDVHVASVHRSFLTNLLMVSNLQREFTAIACLYLKRLKHVCGGDTVVVGTDGAIRLFCVALVVANKMFDDARYTSKVWGTISGIGNEQLNIMEAELLMTLDWNLHVRPPELRAWQATLSSMCGPRLFDPAQFLTQTQSFFQHRTHQHQHQRHEFVPSLPTEVVLPMKKLRRPSSSSESSTLDSAATGIASTEVSDHVAAVSASTEASDHAAVAAAAVTDSNDLARMVSKRPGSAPPSSQGPRAARGRGSCVTRLRGSRRNGAGGSGTDGGMVGGVATVGPSSQAADEVEESTTEGRRGGKSSKSSGSCGGGRRGGDGSDGTPFFNALGGLWKKRK